MDKDKERNRKFKLATGIVFLVTVLILMAPFGIHIISENTFASVINNTIIVYIGGNVVEKGFNTWKEIRYTKELDDAYRDGA